MPTACAVGILFCNFAAENNVKMPSNRNNGKLRRTPLDLPVIHDLEVYEYNFCLYVDKAFPAKFRHSYVKQILNSLSGAMEAALIGMTYDKNIFPKKKLEYIELAMGKLYHVSTRLNRLNDMEQVKDGPKEVLDKKLFDIIKGFAKFANSLRSNISLAGQVSSGTPYGETGELEGCHTGQQ